MLKNVEIYKFLVRDSRAEVQCNRAVASENQAKTLIPKQKPIFNMLHYRKTKQNICYYLRLYFKQEIQEKHRRDNAVSGN